MVGSTGMTSDCKSAYAPTAAVSTARIARLEVGPDLSATTPSDTHYTESNLRLAAECTREAKSALRKFGDHSTHRHLAIRPTQTAPRRRGPAAQPPLARRGP